MLQIDGAAKENTVLITGFGPFRHYTTNPSWELVKRVVSTPKKISTHGFLINYVAHQLPVSYSEVDRLIPEFVDASKPFLSVHCGVSSQAKCLTLEKRARRQGYKSKDVNDLVPCDGCCCYPEGISLDDELTELKTCLNVEIVCSVVSNVFGNNNASNCEVSVPSTDAGRYLCEYCYFKSLAKTGGWSLFVHVPDYNSLVEGDSVLGLWSEQLAVIIEEAVRQRLQAVID